MLSFQPYYSSAYVDPFDSVFFPRRSVRVNVTPTHRCVRPVSRSATLFDLVDILDARPQRHHHHRHQSRRQEPQRVAHCHPVYEPAVYNASATPSVKPVVKQVAKPVTKPVAKPVKPVAEPLQVTAEGTQDEDSYTIEVSKSNGSNDFVHYSIYYEIKKLETLITIKSNQDNFVKVYSFDNDSINLEGITWKTTNNSLIVSIPKNIKKPVESPKRQRIEKPKVISIPIQYGDDHQSVPLSRSNSENTTPEPESETQSELSTPAASDSESDNEEISSSLPKLTKRVSLEEIEDESLMDLD